MDKKLAGYLFPHPPIIIEDIGLGEEKKAKKTVEGCKKLAKDIKDKKPDTIIVITPHGPLFADAISISLSDYLKGDFKNFGNKDLSFNYKNNIELVNKIIDKSSRHNIPLAKVNKDFAREYNIDLKLDHGALVPLYFVDKEYKDFKLIHITYGLLSPGDLYKFGKIIQEVILESGENAALIASGDLSHKLSNEGPYAYSIYGKQFDEKIVKLLEQGNFKSIISFDLDLSEKAGECGLRSFMILAGFLDGYKIEPKVLSYEGPFGVGYATAKFSVVEKDEDENIYEELKKLEVERIHKVREKEAEHVRLARNSLEQYIRYGKVIKPPKHLSQELLNNRQGVFVTLKNNGLLRGCIGTIEPTKESLAEEIIQNAISAGTKDPRFDSVTEEELSFIRYSVDVLNPPEPIRFIEELNVEKYGVIVTKGFKRGLLLPNLDGIDTPEEQVNIALRKAGIRESEGYTLERFQVIRYF